MYTYLYIYIYIYIYIGRLTASCHSIRFASTILNTRKFPDGTPHRCVLRFIMSPDSYGYTTPFQLPTVNDTVTTTPIKQNQTQMNARLETHRTSIPRPDSPGPLPRPGSPIFLSGTYGPNVPRPGSPGALAGPYKPTVPRPGSPGSLSGPRGFPGGTKNHSAASARYNNVYIYIYKTYTYLKHIYTLSIV
jgi:hypothetical protein